MFEKMFDWLHLGSMRLEERAYEITQNKALKKIKAQKERALVDYIIDYFPLSEIKNTLLQGCEVKNDDFVLKFMAYYEPQINEMRLKVGDRTITKTLFMTKIKGMFTKTKEWYEFTLNGEPLELSRKNQDKLVYKLAIAIANAEKKAREHQQAMERIKNRKASIFQSQR